MFTWVRISLYHWMKIWFNTNVKAIRYQNIKSIWKLIKCQILMNHWLSRIKEIQTLLLFYLMNFIYKCLDMSIEHIYILFEWSSFSIWELVSKEYNVMIMINYLSKWFDCSSVSTLVFIFILEHSSSSQKSWSIVYVLFQ